MLQGLAFMVPLLSDESLTAMLHAQAITHVIEHFGRRSCGGVVGHANFLRMSTTKREEVDTARGVY